MSGGSYYSLSIYTETAVSSLFAILITKTNTKMMWVMLSNQSHLHNILNLKVFKVLCRTVRHEPRSVI